MTYLNPSDEGLYEMVVWVLHLLKVKLREGLIGICKSLFPQYLIRAIFDGDCQVVVPDNLLFSYTIFLDGWNIIT